MSFEEEFAVLAIWYRQKIQKYFEAVEEERRRGEAHGLDSELGAMHKQDIAEYNRRLILLKVKYGKELDEGDIRIYDAIKAKESHRGIVP